MRQPVPTPPELGELDGLAYALFLPEGEPDAGVVILHGAGSAKESHFDFARGCRADGLAALAYDARGHGRSAGAFGPGAIDDALAMVALLREHVQGASAQLGRVRAGPLPVALRGSSMGAFQAIHAAARDPSLCAVVAICPAPEDILLRGLGSAEPLRFECDVPAARDWLGSLDLYDAVGRLGPSTGLLLLHARGDEQIPWTVSERLHARAQAAGSARRATTRLLVLPGGHHRSLQHDLELQALSRRFIRDAARQHGA